MPNDYSRNYGEEDDIPKPRKYDVLEAGFYTGHIWDKSQPVTYQKKNKSGEFQMWTLVFRLTHKLSGEALLKPVVIRTAFFEGQMVMIRGKVGFPMLGKPVIVGTIVEEYDKQGDIEFEKDGKTIKVDFETGKPVRKITRAQVSKVDRGERGSGIAMVDTNPSGVVYSLDEMNAVDLEEGRSIESEQKADEEDLPF